jgi:hypothetical protein
MVCMLHYLQYGNWITALILQQKDDIMRKLKMFCPGCGAVIITTAPQALISELCPGCRLHVWDMYDALMADVVPQEPHQAGSSNIHPDN